MFKGQTVPVTSSEDQNVELGKAVDARHRKSGKAAVNSMTKSITKLMGSKAKGTRVHSEVEVFSKMMYKDNVQEMVKKEIEAGALVTKEEKLRGLKELTRKVYDASSEEVRALCKAKVQEERDSKAQVILGGLKGGGGVCPTNEQALEECTGPISQFLQAIQHMTGFEWTVIGAGPDPRLDGKLNALTYHTGVNHAGRNWHESTPDLVELSPQSLLGVCRYHFPRNMLGRHACLNYVPPSPPRDPTPDSNTAVIPLTTDLNQMQGLFLTGAQLTGLPMEALLPAHPDAILSHNASEISAATPHLPSIPSWCHGTSLIQPPPIMLRTMSLLPLYLTASHHSEKRAAGVDLPAVDPGLIFDEHPAQAPTPTPTADERTSTCTYQHQPKPPAATPALTMDEPLKRADAPPPTVDEHISSTASAPRKTGRVRQATTRLTQANNIGEVKVKRKAATIVGDSACPSSKRRKS
ncbi:uncharacterized protein EDB91DRAFT_1087974 [Suillus paluster]|uniref:uncharacterized protein n=1 Tax=Suillus paluster TaxID=48578 RepID=UPI001B873B9B|nr:uncharacterized protein EDB91DRAFT_1087974 [Suillus paluster]KAG1722939.1 hypothetical protein EDB91DRAFT_1087974 [Suillus paluster]